MRKFLISILIILLMILACFLILNDIPIGNWKNKNIDDIKQLNANLDEQIEIAKELKKEVIKFYDIVLLSLIKEE